MIPTIHVQSFLLLIFFLSCVKSCPQQPHFSYKKLNPSRLDSFLLLQHKVSNTRAHQMAFKKQNRKHKDEKRLGSNFAILVILMYKRPALARAKQILGFYPNYFPTLVHKNSSPFRACRSTRCKLAPPSSMPFVLAWSRRWIQPWSLGPCSFLR